MIVEQTLSSAVTPIENGITLVEASAGTGKTFAISMHVLRAVVELEIKIEQILVVTFTVAATEELRERIRRRLLEGRDILRNSDQDYDEVLGEWAAGIQHKDHALALLDLALLEIDCIGIFTIHGFCQRMLTEQPLESGQLFDVELVGEARQIKKSVVNDYWRATFYRFDKRYCPLITERYPDPESLFQSVAGAEDLLAELIPEPGSVDNCCVLVESRFAEFQQWWQKNSSVLRRELDQASSGGYLNKELNNNYQSWCQELEQYLCASQPPSPQLVGWLRYDYLLTQLNGHKLRGLDKKETFMSGWGLPGELIPAYIAAVDGLVLEIRLELADQLRKTYPHMLVQHRKMTFDDLIIRLATAVSGSAGRLLRQKIRNRFRMVLIDEFQDTDSAQWQIFNELFCTSQHILYLIGDPKQAIYRFRGADIFSYFQAREQAQRTLTLHRNFRSHPALVKAVNDLLGNTSIAGLPYKRVEPARKAEDGRLADDEGERGQLVYCQLGVRSGKQPQWSGGPAHERIREWIVAEIARLITEKNKVRIERGGGGNKFCDYPVQPADIAILVRTNSQAEAYHEALSHALIPSVVASKTSVFKTIECEQLLLVMRAVAAPANTTGLKAALSIDWYGLTGDYFILLNGDESLLGQWVERYQSYQQDWQEQGFLVMITKLLVRERIFVNLATGARGERRIANIQHLSELVQEQVQQQGLTIEQTIIWLQEMISSELGVDDMELRLESDEEAVTIVTIHGAKGLEFPVTFCPYLMTPSRSGQGAHSITRCYDGSNRLVVDLGSGHLEENRARAHEEEVQEDLRLAYVAMTRAQLRCYLFWADLKGWGGKPGSFQSSLGTILFPDGSCDFDGQHDHLQLLGSSSNTSYLTINETTDKISWVMPATKEDPLTAEERGRRSFTTNRMMTSFSGLVSFTAHNEDVLPGASDEKGVENSVLESSRLPGGVRFGNIVHDALETINFSDLAAARYDQNQIDRLCQRYGLEVDQNGLKQLLKNSVTTRLFKPQHSRSSFALADIAPDQQVKELEFSLFMDQTSSRDINRVLASQKTCIPLLYREMEGFLNGYVDLICLHDGRYYVIDYKTNHLGDGIEDYRQAALTAAMRVHNYGLQYWLYTLVVHRYLKRWLSNYSYTDHFGGVMYLFVRGMLPEEDGSGVFYDFPEEQALLEFDHCFGEQS